MWWFPGGNAAALYLHVMSFYGATALGAPAWVAVVIPCVALIMLALVVTWREVVRPKDIHVAVLTAWAAGVGIPGVVLPGLADEDVGTCNNAPEWAQLVGFSAFGVGVFYLCTFLEVPRVGTVILVTGAYAFQTGVPIVLEWTMRPRRRTCPA